MKKYLLMLLSFTLLLGLTACGSTTTAADSGTALNGTAGNMITPGEEETIAEAQQSGPIAAHEDVDIFYYDITTAYANQKEEELEDEQQEGAEPVNWRGYINIYEVNVRNAPAAGAAVAANLRKGTNVTISAIFEDEEYTWAEIQQGWVVLKYITVTEKYEVDPDAGFSVGAQMPTLTEDDDDSGYIGIGTINYFEVNIRKEPSTDAEVVVTVKKGTGVTIYETKASDSLVWGRCDQGWVAMKYVDLMTD